MEKVKRKFEKDEEKFWSGKKIVSGEINNIYEELEKLQNEIEEISKKINKGE